MHDPSPSRCCSPTWQNTSPCEARFRREFEVVRRIAHPVVPGALACDMDAASPFIVFEYVEATSASWMLSTVGRFSVEKAAVASPSRCSAPSVRPTGEGVVHRDVKPGNILVAGGNTAWLVDFGIASDQHTHEPLTLAGGALGSPGFMAPEQVRGGQGHRCAHRRLRGGRDAGEPADRSRAIPRLPEPVSRASTVCLSPLAWVVRRACASSPANRFESALDMARGALPRVGPERDGHAGAPWAAEAPLASRTLLPVLELVR